LAQFYGVLENSKLPQHIYEEGHRVAEITLGIWKLKGRAGTEIKGICPNVMFNQSEQSNEFGHSFN
jgi:hypothetical protein